MNRSMRRKRSVLILTKRWSSNKTVILLRCESAHQYMILDGTVERWYFEETFTLHHYCIDEMFLWTTQRIYTDYIITERQILWWLSCYPRKKGKIAIKRQFSHNRRVIDFLPSIKTIAFIFKMIYLLITNKIKEISTDIFPLIYCLIYIFKSHSLTLSLSLSLEWHLLHPCVKKKRKQNVHVQR